MGFDIPELIPLVFICQNHPNLSIHLSLWCITIESVNMILHDELWIILFNRRPTLYPVCILQPSEFWFCVVDQSHLYCMIFMNWKWLKLYHILILSTDIITVQLQIKPCLSSKVKPHNTWHWRGCGHTTISSSYKARGWRKPFRI